MTDIKIEELLKSIIAHDKTPEYKYGEQNAKLEIPAQGTKWLTPREIAENIIKELD